MEDQATPAEIAAWMARDDGDGGPAGPLDPEDFLDDGNRPPDSAADELAAMTAGDEAPWPAEAVAAGFTHRLRGSRPGYGFEGGGVLDLLAPGPVLAGFAAEAAERLREIGSRVSSTGGSPAGASEGQTGAGGSPEGGGASPAGAAGSRSGVSGSQTDPAGSTAGLTDGSCAAAELDDDELIGVICAWRRLASWAAAGETEAVAELGRRRAAQSRARKNRHLIEHLPDELAAALTLTGRSAIRLTALAAELDRLPSVRAALGAGIIDWPRAVVFADELAVLGDEAARIVESLVLPEAGDLTTSRLRARLRRAILALDPEAAARRRQRGRQDARVEVWEEPSGNAALAGRDLPSAQVIAADQRLTAQARWLQRHGAAGTLAQLRAAVFTALLTGVPVTSLLPRSPAAGDDPGEAGSPAAGAGAPATAAGSAAPGDSRPAGLTGTVNLTMPLATWLGWAQRPGEVTGYGPADAETCRELAAMLAASGKARWCLTLTGPDGRAVAHGCARGSPPPSSVAGPPGVAPPGTRPPGTGPPRTGPPRTGPRGTGPRGTGPPGAGPPRTGPWDGDVGAWLAGVAVTALESGACGHRRESARYRPPPSLRHAVHIRQRTCSFPGCRRPAGRCDDDHTIPWEQGGRTCECNLAALCRKHHRAKQAEGWSLSQPEPGHLTWQLPHGRRYATLPEDYPG